MIYNGDEEESLDIVPGTFSNFLTQQLLAARFRNNEI